MGYYSELHIDLMEQDAEEYAYVRTREEECACASCTDFSECELCPDSKL